LYVATKIGTAVWTKVKLEVRDKTKLIKVKLNLTHSISTGAARSRPIFPKASYSVAPADHRYITSLMPSLTLKRPPRHPFHQVIKVSPASFTRNQEWVMYEGVKVK
jgi:hypothetical protein